MERKHLQGQTTNDAANVIIKYHLRKDAYHDDCKFHDDQRHAKQLFQCWEAKASKAKRDDDGDNSGDSRFCMDIVAFVLFERS